MTLERRIERAEARARRCPACRQECPCQRRREEEAAGPTDLDREIDALLADAADRRGLELVGAVADDPRLGLSAQQRAALREVVAERLRAPGEER